MSLLRNLHGQKFGRLTVVGRAPRVYRGHAYWRCACDCGGSKDARSDRLRTGVLKSCGCLPRDITIARNRAGATHRRTKTPEYRAWANMKDRCYRKSHREFRYYGGAGVTVCLRWLRSFEAFLGDVGERPPGMVRSRPLYSLDRYPDRNGNYEPGNCRWATAEQQAQNRRPAKKRGSR